MNSTIHHISSVLTRVFIFVAPLESVVIPCFSRSIQQSCRGILGSSPRIEHGDEIVGYIHAQNPMVSVGSDMIPETVAAEQ